MPEESQHAQAKQKNRFVMPTTWILQHHCLELCRSISSMSALCMIGVVCYTLRSYLEAEVKQPTTSMIGVEPVKDILKYTYSLDQYNRA